MPGPLDFAFEGRDYIFKRGDPFYLFPGGSEVPVTKINFFNQVVAYLVEKELITWASDQVLPQLNLFRINPESRDLIPAYSLLTAIGNARHHRIHIKATLQEFVEMGFRTPVEYAFFREDQRDKASNLKSWITLAVAGASLIVSVAGYLANSGKREVTITNSGAFRDTIAVKIIRPMIDTVYLRGTSKATIRKFTMPPAQPPPPLPQPSSSPVP